MSFENLTFRLSNPKASTSFGTIQLPTFSLEAPTGGSPAPVTQEFDDSVSVKLNVADNTVTYNAPVAQNQTNQDNVSVVLNVAEQASFVNASYLYVTPNVADNSTHVQTLSDSIGLSISVENVNEAIKSDAGNISINTSENANLESVYTDNVSLYLNVDDASVRPRVAQYHLWEADDNVNLQPVAVDSVTFTEVLGSSSTMTSTTTTTQDFSTGTLELL